MTAPILRIRSGNEEVLFVPCVRLVGLLEAAPDALPNDLPDTLAPALLPPLLSSALNNALFNTAPGGELMYPCSAFKSSRVNLEKISCSAATAWPDKDFLPLPAFALRSMMRAEEYPNSLASSTAGSILNGSSERVDPKSIFCTQSNEGACSILASPKAGSDRGMLLRPVWPR